MYFRVFIKFRVCTCIHDTRYTKHETRYTISTSFVYTRSHLWSEDWHKDFCIVERLHTTETNALYFYVGVRASEQKADVVMTLRFGGLGLPLGADQARQCFLYSNEQKLTKQKIIQLTWFKKWNKVEQQNFSLKPITTENSCQLAADRRFGNASVYSQIGNFHFDSVFTLSPVGNVLFRHLNNYNVNLKWTSSIMWIL